MLYKLVIFQLRPCFVLLYFQLSVNVAEDGTFFFLYCIFIAICNSMEDDTLFCLNGGTCLYPNKNCTCPFGWEGNTCEIGNGLFVTMHTHNHFYSILLYEVVMS